MRYRSPLAALLSLLLASSSFAQTVGAVVAPRLSGGVPVLTVPGTPALDAGLAMPLPAPLALTSALTALAPAAAAPSAPVALNAAKRLTGVLSAASAQGKDHAPVLSAAFDGLSAASAGDGVPAVSGADSPELFALQARSLLANVLRSAQGAVIEASPVTDDEILKRMNELPLDNKQREAYIAALFKLAGAEDADIEFQPAGRGFNNVIVT